MKISYEQNKNIPQRGITPWVRRLILSWLSAAAMEYFLLPSALRDLNGLTGLARMSAGRMFLVAAVVFVLLSVLSRLIPSDGGERWGIAGVFAVLAGASLAVSFTWAYLAVCGLILAVLVIYGLRGWNGAPGAGKRSVSEQKAFGWLTAAGALLFFCLVSAWTVGRIYSFSTPTFDFTIFAQMFHSMRATGLPITTVERDGPLSHFAVHVSPIYYLMLPFYCIAPYPATLQVLQAAVLASAVIPLWKLGKLHGLSPLQRSLLCFVLLLYPAYAGGTSYDIHENAFLTPLILWLFYGIDRKHGVLTAIAALLTLMVKEDAAVYVAVIGLYLILRALVGGRGRWELAMGCGILIGALVWFAAVTGYLAKNGDGVMTYRYENFMFDGSDSLVTVIKAVLLNPMKAVFECVDAEKLEFIALTLLPLAGMPFLTRRYERFVLLIPYVLVNLMSDYQYQHDIFFQYTYGSTACLIYMTLVNLADLKLDFGRLLALYGALCIGAACFGAQVLPKALKYPSNCVTYSGYYDALRQELDAIPEDASAAATTFYTTYLSQRDILYDVRYASKEHLLECEYVAISPDSDKSYKKYGGYEAFVQMLETQGYELIGGYKDRLEIYQKTT